MSHTVELLIPSTSLSCDSMCSFGYWNPNMHSSPEYPQPLPKTCIKYLPTGYLFFYGKCNLLGLIAQLDLNIIFVPTGSLGCRCVLSLCCVNKKPLSDLPFWSASVPLSQSLTKRNLYYCLSLFDCAQEYPLCSSRLTAPITRLSPQACDGGQINPALRSSTEPASFHRADTQPDEPDS